MSARLANTMLLLLSCVGLPAVLGELRCNAGFYNTNQATPFASILGRTCGDYAGWKHLDSAELCDQAGQLLPNNKPPARCKCTTEWWYVNGIYHPGGCRTVDHPHGGSALGPWCLVETHSDPTSSCGHGAGDWMYCGMNQQVLHQSRAYDQGVRTASLTGARFKDASLPFGCVQFSKQVGRRRRYGFDQRVGFNVHSSDTTCQPNTCRSICAREPCAACPRGKYSSEQGSSKCTPCAVGQHANQTGQLACQACARGQFTNRTGQPECQPCAADPFSNQTTCKADDNSVVVVFGVFGGAVAIFGLALAIWKSRAQDGRRVTPVQPQPQPQHVASAGAGAGASTISVSPAPATVAFKVIFGEGSMGMRIASKEGEGVGPDDVGKIFVNSVVPGGAADTGGVRVGDALVQVSGETAVGFDATMQAFKDVGRPVEVTFQGTRKAEPVVVSQPAVIVPNPTPVALNPPPPGAPPGGTWILDSYCGPVTCLIGFCVFCFVCCCPCDKRLVYQAPTGQKYNAKGHLVGCGW